MNKSIIWVLVAAVIVLGAWMVWGNRDTAGTVDNAPNTQGNDTGTNTGNNGSNNNATNTNPLANLPVVGTQATSGEIVITSPKLGDKIGSPVTVTGRARGGWYFEASAPVMVIDTMGKVLGRGFVMAEGEWMTPEFVPFKGTITFDKPNTEGGAIIFMNDNPSGDESRAKYLAIPVFFE